MKLEKSSRNLRVSGFPQAIAAIDCCHTCIKAPSKNPEDCINRKEYHSIVFQGLVDNRYLFRDIFADISINKRTITVSKYIF